MSRRKKLLLWALFILYLAILLRITVFRSRFGSFNLFSGTIVWIPFVELFGRTLQTSFFQFVYLFIGNLIWFVPFGLLLPLLTRRRSSTILLGFFLSLCIEILQFIFGTGVSEVEDLILNTLGTAIGYGLYLLLRRVNGRKGYTKPSA